MITICPHCQTPLAPSRSGETRCPSCGFRVLPQAGVLCPHCHTYSLATCTACQHCHAPLPTETGTSVPHYETIRQQFHSVDKVRVLRLCIVIVFGILCFLGMRNYLEDRRAVQDMAQAEQAAKRFAEHYMDLQMALQRHVFVPLQTTGHLQNLTVPELKALQTKLNEVAIPQAQTCLQDLQALSPKATRLLRAPQRIEEDLARQIGILKAISHSLKALAEGQDATQTPTVPLPPASLRQQI